MKKLLATIVFASFVASMSVEAAPSVTVSTMAKSAYLGGNGEIFANKPVLQSDVYTTFNNGVWLDLWHSAGFTSGLDSGYDDEIDVGAGWAGAVSPNGLSLNVGVNHFNVYQIDKINGDDLVQLYAELSKGITINGTPSPITVTPYVRVETLKDLGSDSVNFESVYFIGEKIAMNMTNLVGITGKISLSYDPGIFGVEPGLRGAFEEQINLKFSDTLTLTPIWGKVINTFPTHTFNYVYGTGLVVSF